MSRVTLSSRRRATVAIVFLCSLALALFQILGPTARLNHSFAPGDLSERSFTLAQVQSPSAHNQLPSRCASVKLVPIEIRTADLAPAEVHCEPIGAVTSTAPPGVELSVPTPPPRHA